MRKLLLFFLAAAPCLTAPLVAQTVIAIPAQQCVWRAGDDPAWAAPNLDESGWQRSADLKQPTDDARYWIRCHADLSPVRKAAQPAVQVRLNAAYELRVNGVLIGDTGNLHSGVFSMNTIHQYPLVIDALQGQPDTIALRVTHRFALPSIESEIDIQAGDRGVFEGKRAQTVLAESAAPLANAVCFALIAVVGLMLLGLFYYDRSRRELLYLSIECLGLAILRGNEFFAAAQMNYSSTLFIFLLLLGNIAGPAAYVPFFFTLARRRVPPLYWLPVGLVVLEYCLMMAMLTPVFSAEQVIWVSSRLYALNQHTLHGVVEQVLIAAAPFAAFWPYRKIASRMRPLAVCSMLWGTASMLWFAIQVTSNPLLRLPNIFVAWRPELLAMRAIVSASVLVVLLGLLFRDQRQATQERALLDGEMEAARQIQRLLVPAAIDTATGWAVDAAFLPMRDVGGDFYLCRTLPEGRQRILLGDVSGKGTAAAMTATLLIGAAERRETDSPAELLQHLNLVLRDSRIGGFATCLCADLAPDGTIIFANAGHLAPYLERKELALENGLPLGIDALAAYRESVFRFAPGAHITLLTDGVVEARDSAGRLFGFDRAALLSTSTADALARTAEAYGQQDDITVLTLRWVARAAITAESPVQGLSPA